jgi:hypothetical protein
MNKLMDNQMHKGIKAQRNKRTEKQPHQPFNKNCSNTQYIMFVDKLVAHWTGREVSVHRQLSAGLG